MSVRVGFVGAGNIANHHFAQFEKIENAQVVGLFDIVVEKAQAAASRFPGAKAYTTFEDMLESARLDALYVCLPPFAHDDYEIQAAKRGIHLFVEKPVRLDLAEASQVAQAIRDGNLISAVGYHWRYLDTTAAAKEVLAGKKVALATGHWIGGFPQVSWWRRKGQSGGQAVEQATHIFDLARYFLGDVESVYALGFSGLMADWPGYDIEDASTTTLRFQSGAIATITSSDLAPRGAGTVGLQLYSRDLVVSINSTSLKVSTPARTEERLPVVNPTQIEDQAFVDAVASGDSSKILSTYSDALKTLAVTLAVNQSIATGEVVQVG